MDSHSKVEVKRPGGDEAVCFTAGPKGAAFGAGVVHAWLSSDRVPPLVVAGISTGAIAAAAMRRCFQQLEAATADRLEECRWTWFRRYLNAVTVDPLDFVWKSIPDPVDFFADKPPVQDLSTELLPHYLQCKANEARRHFHILTKFGVWLAGLPVRLGTMASILVYYVRHSEVDKSRPFSFLFSYILLQGFRLKALLGLWWHLARSPRFFSERPFRRPIWKRTKGSDEKCWIFPFRPLFGWLVWVISIVVPLLLLYTEWRAMQPRSRLMRYIGSRPAAFAVETVVFAFGLWILCRSKFVGLALPKYLLKQLDVTAGILDPFELKRRIHELFGGDNLKPELGSGRETHVLLVAAVLQRSEQVWPKEDVPLEKALSAALAVPGMFPPEIIDAKYLDNYQGPPTHAQVIDGVAVRNNPIPAFFEWCKRNPEISRRLQEAAQPALHVVYNVPIRPVGSVTDAKPREWIDILEAAQISLALEKRRDTRQEVRQADFIASLEEYRRLAVGSCGQEAVRYPRIPIVPDEIAPREEITFTNAWNPSRDESLKMAAQGCRETLERLYADELKPAGPEGVGCARLLRGIAERRKCYINEESPGIHEVCRACTRILHHRPAQPMQQPAPGIIRSFGQPGDVSKLPLRTKLFPHLSGPRPRIVFLGNGGVFRGAFHIGVIGAMKTARVFPDMVVGASVGMLMGGALASIAVAETNTEDALLDDLADTFLHVDKRVALTRTIKNAAKQLGIRARQVRLSPSEIRRKVLCGSRDDAGYAATGAPPALIDAISSLFMIPHRRTAAIASQFVAGHFGEATSRFLREVRRETLASVGIEHSLIGISLLEERAAALMGTALPNVCRNEVQPWHYPAGQKRPVSVFGTTSFLNAQVSLVLGRDFLTPFQTPNPTWDSVFAGLSSSAFPAVFSPRSEADVLPGIGRSDRLLADGGLFDNLPFIPAIEILGAIQSAEILPNLPAALQRLQHRTENRDIFVAAALDADPAPGGPYDTLFKIHARSGELAANSKAASFDRGSERTHEALTQIVAGSDLLMKNLPTERHEATAKFLDQVVNAAVLKVIPTDKAHINPTFAFCKSMGLKERTVATSIADGCFQSLLQFAEQWKKDKTVHAAFSGTAVADGLKLEWTPRAAQNECPFYVTNSGRIHCPFASETVRQVKQMCSNDEKHKAKADA